MKRRKNNQPKKVKTVLRKFINRFLYLVLGIVLLGVAFIFIFTRNLPDSERLENISPNLPSQVYSADGVLLKEFLTDQRIYKPLSEFAPLVVNSILATEDHHFEKHWGIYPPRFVKVTLSFLLTGSKEEGASTITQQLARTLYLTLDKNVTRKINEVFTAIQLERRYTKDELIEMYLNHVQFAFGTYGYEAAAQKYFGKTNTELGVEECAVLTGMLQAPGRLNPSLYAKSERIQNYVKTRRDLVLRRMLRHEFITAQEYDEAVQKDIVFASQDSTVNVDIAPYFTEEVRRKMYAKDSTEIYTSGMQIFTTIDSRVQACAESAVKNHLPELQKVVNRNMHKRKNFVKLVPPSMFEKRSLEAIMADTAYVDSLIAEKCKVQVALVALDPRTGNILAMIGGRNFKESEFNRAVQAVRQPGSVFKPFVYTAAVDNGIMPFYEKLNQPIVVHMVDGTRWTPHNYDGSLGGLTTMREALRRSLNLVTARLVQEDVPPEEVIRYARYLGITTPLQAVDAIALGAIGVHPIEIISAFGAFANKGVLVEPHYVSRVEDKYGNVIDRANPQSKGVLREETAYIIADLLKTVASRGTGIASRSRYNFYRPAGGKTGTTNDFTDAWYVTFTPQIVSGVWVGLDDPSMSLGERQSGARAALPINAPFIKAAHDTLQLPVMDFEKPENVVQVEVCRETKQLATDYCPDVLSEICDVRFLPQTKCEKHTGERESRSSNNRRLGL